MHSRNCRVALSKSWYCCCSFWGWPFTWELHLQEALAFFQARGHAETGAKMLRRLVWRQSYELPPVLWISMNLRRMEHEQATTVRVGNNGFFGCGRPFQLVVADRVDAHDFGDILADEAPRALASLGYADRLHVGGDSWPDWFLDRDPSDPVRHNRTDSVRILDCDLISREDLNRLCQTAKFPDLVSDPADLQNGTHAIVLLPQFLLRRSQGMSDDEAKALLEHMATKVKGVRAVFRTWAWSVLAFWVEPESSAYLGDVMCALGDAGHLAQGTNAVNVWTDTTLHYRPRIVRHRLADLGLQCPFSCDEPKAVIRSLLESGGDRSVPQNPLAFSQRYWVPRVPASSARPGLLELVQYELDEILADSWATCQLTRKFDGQDIVAHLRLGAGGRYPLCEREVPLALALQHLVARLLKDRLVAFEVATRVALPVQGSQRAT